MKCVKVQMTIARRGSWPSVAGGGGKIRLRRSAINGSNGGPGILPLENGVTAAEPRSKGDQQSGAVEFEGADGGSGRC